MRTDAQKAANARYNAKTQKTIGFATRKEEAAEISEYIDSTGMTKIAFLRAAIAAHKEKKF